MHSTSRPGPGPSSHGPHKAALHDARGVPVARRRVGRPLHLRLPRRRGLDLRLGHQFPDRRARRRPLPRRLRHCRFLGWHNYRSVRTLARKYQNKSISHFSRSVMGPSTRCDEKLNTNLFLLTQLGARGQREKPFGGSFLLFFLPPLFLELHVVFNPLPLSPFLFLGFSILYSLF